MLLNNPAVSFIPATKIILSLHLGGRRQEDAYALLHDPHLRLEDDYVPAFTSDGLRSYVYAITVRETPGAQPLVLPGAGTKPNAGPCSNRMRSSRKAYPSLFINSLANPFLLSHWEASITG